MSSMLTSGLFLALMEILTAHSGRLPKRLREQGGAEYIRKATTLIEQSADRKGVRPELLASLIFHESAFNWGARSKVGARGPGQLYGPSLDRWWAACREDAGQCYVAHFDISAEVLAGYIQKCGSEEKGVSAYTGRSCVRHPHSRQVIIDARRIRRLATKAIAD